MCNFCQLYPPKYHLNPEILSRKNTGPSLSMYIYHFLPFRTTCRPLKSIEKASPNTSEACFLMKLLLRDDQFNASSFERFDVSFAWLFVGDDDVEFVQIANGCDFGDTEFGGIEN